MEPYAFAAAGETKTKEMIEMGNGTMRDFGDHYSINLGMSLKLVSVIKSELQGQTNCPPTT